MNTENIFKAIPNEFEEEIFEDLVRSKNVRIERILSHGQSSPAQGWYDQDENEWVIVLQGQGTLTFEEGRSVTLAAGDYINIPAHTRHKVSWTDPDNVTIWLAVFYSFHP